MAQDACGRIGQHDDGVADVEQALQDATLWRLGSGRHGVQHGDDRNTHTIDDAENVLPSVPGEDAKFVLDDRQFSIVD